MTLYHFTASQHIAKINTTGPGSGIRLGVVPFSLRPNGGMNFMKGWQWLTENPDWDQEWDNPGTLSKLPFRRTEWRITVDIPSLYTFKVVRWPAFDARYQPPSREYLNAFRGNHHWRLFHGAIPVSWFVAVEHNPVPLLIPDEYGKV